MKKLFFTAIIAQSMLLMACSKSDVAVTAGNNINDYTTVEQGVAKGRVLDEKGNPVINAEVVIENTILYASYVYAYTDANGYYKTSVPIGSWKASVQMEKDFLGKGYIYDLHPDNANSFAGATGAVRNFTWKISGTKPDGSYYGSPVKAYGDLLSFINMADVELTLTPVGTLIDGNAGAIIKKRLVDVGGGEYGIDDVPVGRYTITAKNVITNLALEIRIRNTGTYDNSVTGIFNSDFQLPSFLYHIVTEVR